jgi:ATP-binding cassette, subfamily B, bacterial CvaB/MchF/RaxB
MTTTQNNANTADVLNLDLVERRKTPLVLQSEAMECGLSCLSMVMSTFGRVMDLTVLRERYPTSQRGLSIARLEEIAAEEGFLLNAYHAEAHEMGELKLPGILHWKGNHFVVMTEYKQGKYVVLHDPAVGIRKVEWSQFVEDFSKACCELVPLSTMKKEVRKERLAMWDLLQKTPGYSSVLAKLGVLALLLEVLTLVSPMFLQLVVDEVVPVQDNRLLWALGIGFVGLAVIRSLLKLTHGWLGMALTGMLTVTMKLLTFNHMLKLPLVWFEKRGVGTVSARYNSLAHIQSILGENLLATAVDAVFAVVMLGVLFAYDWRLAFMTTIVSVVSFGITAMMYGRYALAAAEGVAAEAAEQRVLVETVTAIPAVKMFGQELRQVRNYHRSVITSTNRMIDMIRVRNWHDALQTLLSALGDVVIVGVAAALVMDGNLSLGVLFGFYAYKQILSTKVSALGQAYFKFRLLSVYADNVSDILLNPTESDESKPFRVSDKPTLRFENITFAYEDSDPTLVDFSLTVNPGEIVGVTGPSGGGKSTLVKLLTGSLRPARGDIVLDTESLIGRAPKDVRKHLAVVLQSDHLMTGTILENVTMFEAKPDLDRVHQALADACILQEVEDLPSGLKFFLMGHAPTLSGGQRQRLMLARAFYKNATVLVLDEATSALDVEKEIHICEAIRRKGLTTLMVAHRQETLARCDRVVRVGD